MIHTISDPRTDSILTLASPRVPPPIPEVEHSDAGVQSIDSLSTTDTHVQSISSTDSSIPSIPSYADQQLEAERNQRARSDGKKQADEIAREAHDFTARVEKDAGVLQSDAKSKYEKARGEAGKEWKSLKKEAKKDGEKVKKEAKKAEQWAEKNKSNPVVVGNAVVIGALTSILGVSAYRMHKAGTLTWNVVGAWAGAVGLFAVGDYYVSQ